MNSEARYLLRVENVRGYQPADQMALLLKIREWLAPLGGKAINLRVSSTALEFDLFCDSRSSIDLFLPAFVPIGTILTRKRLDLPSRPVDAKEAVREARQLFNEERYWEVHEVLENVWKKSIGPERELIQGLILAAAALVHVQKNEMAVVLSMLRDALRRLDNKPASYFDWDVRAFRETIRQWLEDERVTFEKV